VGTGGGWREAPASGEQAITSGDLPEVGFLLVPRYGGNVLRTNIHDELTGRWIDTLGGQAFYRNLSSGNSQLPVQISEVTMANPKAIKLIVSETEPKAVAHSHKVEVAVVDEHLKPAKPIGARLCGGTNTCLAIVETE